MSIKKTEVKCRHRKVSEFKHLSPQAKKIIPVEERCPNCGEYGMRHFDWRGARYHFRECPNCGVNEKIENWELTCSCGKQPPESFRGSTTRCSNKLYS